MRWMERRWVLIALGILLLANIAFFFTYRVRYQQRVEALDTSLTGARAALQRARDERMKAEQTIAGFRKIERDIQMIYDDHWSTPERRLTQLLLELRAMENRSQLIPQTTSFALNETTTKDFGTREMGIQFTVVGTYGQIRQLINLIELSPHFVVIDSIALGESGEEGGKSISLTLALKTLFRPSEDQETRPGKVL